jgi:hypothetical protein
VALFSRKRVVQGGPTGVSGLDDLARSWGLQAAGEHPVEGHLADRVEETSRVLHGAARSVTRLSHVVVGSTVYSDAYAGLVGDRQVTVANGWTEIESDAREHLDWHGVSVCVVELPTVLLLSGIEPRQRWDAIVGPECPTGDASFDGRYRVVGAPGASGLITSEVQRIVGQSDDWVFLAEGAQLACVSAVEFRGADDVAQRIRDVLAVVAGFPTGIVPDHVDHSFDALLQRLDQLHSVEEALAFLQALTPEDRERLARSDSPLAAFADVQTPDQAMARLKSLDEQQKMQLFAMFMKAKDQRQR